MEHGKRSRGQGALSAKAENAPCSRRRVTRPITYSATRARQETWRGSTVPPWNGREHVEGGGDRGPIHAPGARRRLVWAMGVRSRRIRVVGALTELWRPRGERRLVRAPDVQWRLNSGARCTVLNTCRLLARSLYYF